MIGDCRAEMGFMEAMLSMFAVVTVLGLYLTFIAMSGVVTDDPLDDFDFACLDLDEGLGLDKRSIEYLDGFVSTHDARGIGVRVTVPYFAEDVWDTFLGERTDMTHFRMHMCVEPIGNGRTVPVMFEVTLCI